MRVVIETVSLISQHAMNAWQMLENDSTDYGENLKKANEIQNWLKGQPSDAKAALALELLAILSDPKHAMQLRTKAALRLLLSAVHLDLHGSRDVGHKLEKIFEVEFAAQSHGEFYEGKAESMLCQTIFRLILICDFERGKLLAKRFSEALPESASGNWFNEILRRIESSRDADS